LRFVIAVIIFSVVILIHELGHFLLAKKNHIEVLEFSLGMGPRILSTVKGGTRYSLKLLPLAGFRLIFIITAVRTAACAFKS
jgi:regulator of sigma E protease